MPSDKDYLAMAEARNTKTVYLAGPINKCSDEEAMSWRERAKEVLHDKGHTTIDPMRRDYRGQEDDFTKTIVQGDLQDIEDCDTMLVNAWKPSFGTAMETWEGSQHLGKDVVVVAPDNCSPWLKHCADQHFAELSTALKFLTQEPWS